MFKDTCLADPQRKDGSPQRLGLGNPRRTALVQHKMKEKVILRILAQESPKLELRLRRYGEKNFRDLFVIYGKWLGVFLEIMLKSMVPVGISVDHGSISDKCRGFFAKWLGTSAGDLFFNRKYRGGPGPRCVDRAV
jgi:hypothetical protein